VTTDDELLAQLRRIADEADAPPDFVTDSARAAFSTRRLDDELADLLRDSDLAPSAVRGVGPRLLSFETAGLSIELQIEQRAGRVWVGGLVIGLAQEIEVQTTTTAPRRIPTDGRGWFHADDLPAEPLRIRVPTTEGTAVTTGWIRP
jgi:hypothetical protein